MSSRYIAKSLLLVLTCVSGAAAGDSPSDLPRKAIEHSQITLPGSRPFVLKTKVLEKTNLANNDYKAEIEEYWAAPDKWRRTVKTSSFSETLIVNGDRKSETLTGDYFPNWLQTIVSAIFEPGEQLKGVDLSRSSDNPMIGGTKLCRRFMSLAGTPPVTNQVFSSYCFDKGLLDSIGVPGYHAEYLNYKGFAGKQVARTIHEYIESGTELEATVEQLTELSSPDESIFAIQESSPPLMTVHASEATLRSLIVSAPDIVWPTIRSGAEKGTLSLYVCLDRTGRIREVYELNSNNPGLSDVARDQVMKWQFKTAANHGVPVQVESILTFGFQTTTADPIPLLEEEEGRKLLISRVEPVWPAGFPSGMPVIVTLRVDEKGQCLGMDFATTDEAHAPHGHFTAAQFAQLEKPMKDALTRWRFRPYMHDGKATVFQAKFTLYVK